MLRVKSNITPGPLALSERKDRAMGIKRIGPGRFSYDIHVWGSLERPRGVLEDTTIHKARAFVAAEVARIKRSGSLADFLAWLERMKAQEYGKKVKKTRRPDSLNAYIALAKGAFNWVRKFHGYGADPLAQVKHLDPENRQLWAYSPENVRDILAAAKGGPYYWVFLALQYWPCRRGEVLNLRGCDIFRKYIRLPDESNKTKEGRTLPIPADRELQRYLAAVPASCPHAFCTVRQNGLGRVPIGGKNILRWLKAHKEALGLPGATLHGFRRTAAVRLDELGVSLPVIAELTGHKDLRTLQYRYLPVSQRQKQEAMEMLVSRVKHGQNLDKLEKRQAAA